MSIQQEVVTMEVLKAKEIERYGLELGTLEKELAKKVVYDISEEVHESSYRADSISLNTINVYDLDIHKGSLLGEDEDDEVSDELLQEYYKLFNTDIEEDNTGIFSDCAIDWHDGKDKCVEFSSVDDNYSFEEKEEEDTEYAELLAEEDTEYNMFIDTLIKFDSSVVPNSLSDYLPLSVSEYISNLNNESISSECLIASLQKSVADVEKLIHNTRYINSLKFYLAKINGNNRVRVKKCETINNYVERLIEDIDKKDVLDLIYVIGDF